MTAPHDAPEAVEALAAWYGENKPWPADVPFPSTSARSAAAAMLRRLHARAVDAEQERDNIAANTVLVVQSIQEAGATYRAECDEARAALGDGA